MARKLGWTLMMLASLGVSGYALAVLFIPGFGPPFIAERRADMPLALAAHLLGGAVALGLGPWQFLTRLRLRAVAVHRWIGRLYLLGVLVGGLGGLAMATVSYEGLVTHLGFGMLAMAWLGTSTMAYRRARQRQFAAHRDWMIRSFALTLAAVTLRIYLPLAQVSGIPFGEAYQVISWLCWVPNLLIAEWVVLRRLQPVVLA